MLHARATWLCALLLLGFVEADVSLDGWIMQFMIRVHDTDPFPAGMTSVGFQQGITLGRAILGLVTPIMYAKQAVALYLYKATRESGERGIDELCSDDGLTQGCGPVSRSPLSHTVTHRYSR
ncbi:hypothetical protein B0T10DRAFT_294594 [Thelonectria olida]|uniref:Uncharacterized protein n=1 Tax=Thelonectria olida TaxID=1576542 RepID=A0A9P9AUA8_9HYPO|nr:hypothetical protein B0T10DRAFT_294594 [Thelonectria olida]